MKYNSHIVGGTPKKSSEVKIRICLKNWMGG